MPSSSGLGAHGVAAYKSNLPGPFICARCRPSARRRPGALLTISNAAFGLRSRRRSGLQQCQIGPARREFHSGKPYYFPSMNVLLDDKSREAFEAELNRKENIISYLRRWQENPTAPYIDPIKPAELRTPEGSERWFGNMLDEHVVHHTQDDYKVEMDEPRHLPLGDYEATPVLRTGDVVLLSVGGASADGILAIYMRTVDEQLHMYTSRGRWRAVGFRDVVYVLNERAPPELITPILPYFPKSAVEMAALPHFALEGGVPRPLSAPLMSLMLDFEKDSSAFYLKNTEILDNIHNVLAKPDNYSVMTMDEIITKALKVAPESLTKAERYAIHKALLRQPFYIIPNRSASSVESYRVRSKQQSKVIDNVVQWTRVRQAHDPDKYSRRSRLKDEDFVGQFATRAKSIVEGSRSLRKPTKSFALGPTPQNSSGTKQPALRSYTKTSTHRFSSNDLSILQFLFLWILPPCNMTAGPLSTAGSTILRATGLYEDYPLTPATGYLFLQELGIVAPWENLHLLTEQLELPGHGFNNESDRLAKKCKSLAARSKPKSLVDTMEHRRKNWGDLPVFCIDSPDAAEIDDGISVEPTTESPETFWIHVHVANPSSFIRPDSEFAQAAAHLKRSIYSVERNYPMLPPALAQEHFSLAPGRPTFTISAKVNMDGDILNTEVVNSRVNNVVYTTPESIQKLFGVDDSQAPTMDLSVGGPEGTQKRMKKKEDPVPEQHRETLSTLEKLLAARRDRRVEKGAVDSAGPQRCMPSVSGGKDQLPPWSAGFQHANFYQGDPMIRLSQPVVDPFETLESTKYDLVSHAMLLAGEVAAKWCMERAIPAVYSGTRYRPEEKISDDSQEQHSSTAYRKPIAFSQSKPTPHPALGMDQYVKCTSPLRRYTDLIAHWQMEAYLRGEEELPFSGSYIDSFTARLDWQERFKSQAEARSRDFWICQLFHRALNFKETKLPETFQCLIVSEIRPVTAKRMASEPMQYVGSILPFRQRCVVEAPVGTEGFQQSDLVDVKPTSVNVYDTIITAEAVRLVKRPKEGTVPINLLFI